MSPLQDTHHLGRNRRLHVTPPDEGIAGAPVMRTEIDTCIEHLDRGDVEHLRSLCDEALS